MDFLRFFGIVLLILAAPALVGLLPHPALVVLAIALVGVGVCFYRNRSLA